MATNEHYVSQVLLRRFKIPGSPLHCYQVETGEWKQRNEDKVCSAAGYNQLLVSRKPDNALDASLWAVENDLPKTFKALEEAAKKPLTELPPAIYENICKYCAFLNLIALHSKPGAVASFVIQINMELEKGEYYLLRNLPKQKLDGWRKECALGGKLIVESENVLQSLYRFQFDRSFDDDCRWFLNSEWTISNSPVELPLSDIGLVTLCVDSKALWSILPIGPQLLLERVLYLDLKRNSPQPLVTSRNLTADEADYRLDAICSSAVTEIICSRINPNIPASISRAKEKGSGITFLKVANAKAITSAGLAKASKDLIFRVVSVDDYKKYMDSFVHRPTPPQAS